MTWCWQAAPGEASDNKAVAERVDLVASAPIVRHPCTAAYRVVAETLELATGLTPFSLFTGVVDDDLDPSEVEGWEWVDVYDLRSRVAAQPGQFTPWFVIAVVAFPELTTADSG